jgi:hypothetical protein
VNILGTEKPGKDGGRFLRDLQSQELTEQHCSSGLFEVLAKLFEFLGMNFNASMQGVTEQHIVSSPVFQSELRSKGIDYETYQRNTSASPDTLAQARYGVSQGVFADDNTADAAFRAVVNIGIERHAEGLEARGVKYGFRDKNSAHGTIDCSGFVNETVKNSMNAALPGESRPLTSIFATHSDGQVSGLARKTGSMLAGRDVTAENMKAGMVIGIDTGDRGWDRGRNLGVDHVGIVYVDTETGQKMFAESRGGGVGVDTTPLDEKLAHYKSKGYKLYASDTVGLASEEQKMEVAQKVMQNSELDKDAVAQNDAKPDEIKSAETAAIAPVV